MARNLHCNCLCHGSDGNVTDSYFCCKNCYAAMHMGGLPRQQSDAPKPKGKKEHKGKSAPRPKRPVEAKGVESGKPVLPQPSN